MLSPSGTSVICLLTLPRVSLAVQTYCRKSEGFRRRNVAWDVELSLTCLQATSTMTTVGYGDVAPTTTAERIVAMIVMLIGALHCWELMWLMHQPLHVILRAAWPC